MQKLETVKPYLVKVIKKRAWNPEYPQEEVCACGHAYERHFDSYDKMDPIGCKYCQCFTFRAHRTIYGETSKV